MSSDTWDPAQYEKFQREREQPFFDLAATVRPAPAMRVVDLGCGTGKQTRLLHRQLDAAETIGIDRSDKMLEGIRREALPPGLHFETGAIEDFPGSRGPFDLIFSNAALHWVDDHRSLLPRLASALAPGGQLAFQVPAMHMEATHLVAEQVAGEDPFRSSLGGWRRVPPVLTAEEYARIFYDCGLAEQRAQLIVYPHVLPGPEAVAEWTKGTLLTEYARHLPQPLFERFVDRYRALLLERLDDARPYFFPFKRILCWGRRSV
jgi:trans-aconitate 2-methyltransferase